jgi:broad specificity phosphatase PhoE
VRHGTTDANQDGLFLGQTDVPLNHNGRTEAHALAKRFSGIEIDILLTSDLQRAHETAQAIAEAHNSGLEIVVDKRLREIHLGDFDGLPTQQVHSDHPDIIQQWIQTPATNRMPGAGAETLGEVQDRMWEVVEELTTANAGPNIMMVSHTFAILSMVCKILGVGLDRFRNLHIDRGSITEIRWGRFGPALRRFNDIAHLEALDSD